MDKKILRTTNIYRLAGLALVVGGSFLPVGRMAGFGVEIDANLTQIIGALLIAWPILRELKKGETK